MDVLARNEVRPQDGARTRSLRQVASFLASPRASVDVRVLYRNWQTAARPSALPLYDEVVLGRTGRAAPRVALIGSDSADSFRILRSGQEFDQWIERDGRVLVSTLQADCARVLNEALSNAIAIGVPVHSIAHGVREDHVAVFDLMVFPLGNRWGPPLLLAYVQEQERHYSLVDTLFASTATGLLALAPVRDFGGQVTDFQIVSLNDSAARLVDRELEDMRWQRLSELFPHIVTAEGIERLVGSLGAGCSEEFELAYPRAAGGVSHFSIRAAGMGDLLALSVTDVTELKSREESFRLLFLDNPMPMFVYDPHNFGLVDVNTAAIEHYGYSKEQFLSRTLLDIRPDEDRQKVKALFAARHIQSDSGEVWRHLRADGTIIEVEVYSRAVKYHGRASRICVVVDVTEQRRAEARIKHLAHHDSLTGLPNRALFLKELHECLERVRRYGDHAAILCLDLDYFKLVNDTLGHPVGDLLLEGVARRLSAILGESDLIARLGGDEFAIIQRDLAAPGEAGLLAERIVAELARPFELDGHLVVVSCSIGIALAPNDGDNADHLLKNADMALYRAKDDGRGTFRYFQPEMDARVRARRALELDLRRAIAAGEFELHYQPFVSTRSGLATGFEALIRWHHPQRGLVPPGDFIPLAEDIGLIGPIGEWVLRQACREAMAWPAHLKVAVNLSAVQFKGQKLVTVVASALANSGLAPGRLELEITESVLLKESEANRATLHQLRALGVRVSMDDFGTGYSSLSYLRSFPFDKIKIDQSFIRHMAENEGNLAIVRAVTGLGTSLGIATTAEGVETAEQMDRLRQAGCDEVQGYFISRPVPASQVAAIIARYAAAPAPPEQGSGR